jgi:hypothetical protein
MRLVKGPALSLISRSFRKDDQCTIIAFRGIVGRRCCRILLEGPLEYLTVAMRAAHTNIGPFGRRDRGLPGPNEKHPQLDRSAGAVIPVVPPKTVSLETNITGELNLEHPP